MRFLMIAVPPYMAVGQLLLEATLHKNDTHQPSTTSQCPSRIGLSTRKKSRIDSSSMRAYAHVGRTSYKAR
jgi:hypothetical protein